MNATWKKVTRAVPCPICGRPDWCTVSGDNMVVKCMRVESSRPIKQSDSQPAWLHPIGDAGKFEQVKSLVGKPSAKRLTSSQVQILLNEFSRNLTSSRLASVSKSLGISKESLVAFGVGYCSYPAAYSFPMFDGQGQPIGIRLRKECGKKLCVTGSRNGLFIPRLYEPGYGIGFRSVTVAPEGPTDAATAWDLGFGSIGRPNNAGGGKMLAMFLGCRPRHDVVVVADRDETKWREPNHEPFWPGIEGALSLCDQIIGVAGKLRFVMPPDGVKDIREWSASGSHASLLSVIVAAPVVTREWLSRAKKRVERMRKAAV